MTSVFVPQSAHSSISLYCIKMEASKHTKTPRKHPVCLPRLSYNSPRSSVRHVCLCVMKTWSAGLTLLPAVRLVVFTLLFSQTEHEMKEVTGGNRLVLIYNLVHDIDESSSIPQINSMTETS